MQTFQQRILARIESIVQKHGYECSMSQDYANTGQVNLHGTGECAAFGKVRFDFQTGYYTLKLEIRGRKIPSQPGRSDYFDFYQDNDKSSDFWPVFDRELRDFPCKRVA